jgi:hypothetical protein
VLIVALCPSPALASPDELAQIRSEIAAKHLNWQADETVVSRKSPEERQRLRMPAGMLPPWVDLRSIPTERPPRLSALPASMDWRNYMGFNFQPTARDQGQCGDCWAFSLVGTLEGTIAIRKSQADPTIDLSEQDLFDCDTLGSLSCSSGGITWYLGENFLQNTGITTEACYPYTSGTTQQKGSCTAQTGACADVTKADAYHNVTETEPGPIWTWGDPAPYIMDQPTMDIIKGLLVERPVGTSMRAYDDLDYYNGGVYEPANTTQGSGLHAVVIVGYNDHPTPPDDPTKPYWIIRNSWNESWGEKGYFRVAYGASSVGMFSYTNDYDEAHKDPAFCPDLPKAIDLYGTAPFALKIANCGSGVLSWQAQATAAGVQLSDKSGPCIADSVVAAGTTYQVASTTGAAASGALTLTGAPNGPVSIAVQVHAGAAADASVPGPDAAHPASDASALPGADAAAIAHNDASAAGEDATIVPERDATVAEADSSVQPGVDSGLVASADAAVPGLDASSTAKIDSGSVAPTADAGDGTEGGGGCSCGATSGLMPVFGALLYALTLTRRRRR